MSLSTLTARDLVTEALRDSGFTADTETPSSEEIQSALRKLNEAIDILNLNKLWPVSQRTETITLVSGIRTYTLGPTGSFVMTRPIDVKALKLLDSNNWLPINKIDDVNWNSMVITTDTVGLPNSFRYSPSYPNGILEFSATPEESYDMELMVNIQTVQYGLDDIIDVPAGYYPYLQARLASDWYMKRKRQNNPSLQQKADLMLDAIEKNNSKSIEMKSGNVRTRYDYKSGRNITYR